MTQSVLSGARFLTPDSCPCPNTASSKNPSSTTSTRSAGRSSPRAAAASCSEGVWSTKPRSDTKPTKRETHEGWTPACQPARRANSCRGKPPSGTEIGTHTKCSAECGRFVLRTHRSAAASLPSRLRVPNPPRRMDPLQRAPGRDARGQLADPLGESVCRSAS